MNVKDWLSIHQSSGYLRWRLRPACLAGALLALMSASVWADTLLDVYRKAQARDPAYRGAIYALQAARERVPQARAGLFPSLNIVGVNSRQSGQVSFGDAPYLDRKVNSWNWNLQLTQPLWRATNWAALNQAEQQELLAQGQFQQSEQELILRTAQAYLDVLVAQEALRVARLQFDAV